MLLCNMALLYCYIQRKNGRNIFGSTDSTMSRSSILEMYFSNSSGSHGGDSQSVNSDVSETIEENYEDEDSEEVASRERVDLWRQRHHKPMMTYPGQEHLQSTNMR